MADASEASRSGPSLEPITRRVVERLAAAGAAFDRRHGASRPKAGRKKPLATLAGNAAADTARRRERACLRSVFLELGDAHRRYRMQTGRSGTPALREAAHAFKREPSVDSLVPVVAFLDELGILAW